MPDGPRAAFPHVLEPGASCVVYLPVQAPAQRGQYQVLIDGVHEGVTWFSQAGVAPLAFSLTVADTPE